MSFIYYVAKSLVNIVEEQQNLIQKYGVFFEEKEKGNSCDF